MRKNSKKQQTNGTSHAETASTPPSISEATPQPKKRARASAKTTGKTASAKTPGKKAAPRKTTRKSETYEPSEVEIRTRAYFVAERRAQMFMQGDPAQDWLDARQQLLDEAAQTRPAGEGAAESAARAN